MSFDVCVATSVSIQTNFKGQLQRFDKLNLFDRFRHAENGVDISFENSFSFSCYKPSKF